MFSVLYPQSLPVMFSTPMSLADDALQLPTYIPHAPQSIPTSGITTVFPHEIVIWYVTFVITPGMKELEVEVRRRTSPKYSHSSRFPCYKDI